MSDQPKSVVLSVFMKKLTSFLEDEEGAVLARVIGYDDESDEWEYDESEALEKLKAEADGHYVVMNGETGKWYCSTRISKGKREKKNKAPLMTGAPPVEGANARVISHLSEAWAVLDDRHVKEIDRLYARVASLEEQLQEANKIILEHAAEDADKNPHQELLEFGKLAVSAIQGRQFKNEALELTKRVLSHFEDEPETAAKILVAVRAELEKDAMKLLAEAVPS